MLGTRSGAVGWGTAGSIPDGVIGIVYLFHDSGLTMVSTQPLTEMSTRNISWG
jgi:hypothetical protein